MLSNEGIIWFFSFILITLNAMPCYLNVIKSVFLKETTFYDILSLLYIIKFILLISI